MRSMILWAGCGLAAMILGVIMQKWKNRDLRIRALVIKSLDFLPIGLLLGPMWLIFGLTRFILDIPNYESKGQYVLRKLQS